MQALRNSAFQALKQTQKRGYASSVEGYASTAHNLKINKDTKVVVQGFTGTEAGHTRYEWKIDELSRETGNIPCASFD